MAGGSADHGNGLIRMSGVRDHPLIGAVGKEIEFLQYGLADEHFIAEHESFLKRIATQKVTSAVR